MERKIPTWLWLMMLPGLGFWASILIWIIWSLVPVLDSVFPLLWLAMMAWIGLMYTCLAITPVCLAFAVIETVSRRTSYHWWLATVVNISPPLTFLPFLISYVNHLQEFFGSLPPTPQ